MVDTATRDSAVGFRGELTFHEARHRINREVERSDFGEPIRIGLRGQARRHLNRLLKWIAECGVHNLALSQSPGCVTITYPTVVGDKTVSSVFVPRHNCVDSMLK